MTNDCFKDFCITNTIFCMKRRVFYFSLLILQVLIVSGCNNKNNTILNSHSPQFLIDLCNVNSNMKSVPLSTIGKSVQYIPLETTPYSLLKTLTRIELCDSIIFVCDNDKLLKFDRAGRFIKQIGKMGRGPGEYPLIYDFSIDRTNQLIFIAASRIKETLIFDFDGNFKKSFKVPYIPIQILVSEMNYILFRNSFPDPNANFNYYITDNEGNILSKYWSYPGRDTRSKLGQSASPMYFFDDKFHFMEYGIDTLYLINNSVKEAYAIFDLGNLKIDPPYPVDFDMEALKEKIWIYKILEDRNNLYMKVSKGWTSKFYHCIYIKKESETITLKEEGFINDLDGGPNIWPQFVTSDTILVSYIEAYQLLNFLNKKPDDSSESTNNDKSVQLRALKNQLTETSNPIVVIVK
jgi:hypothetical protein